VYAADDYFDSTAEPEQASDGNYPDADNPSGTSRKGSAAFFIAKQHEKLYPGNPSLKKGFKRKTLELGIEIIV